MPESETETPASMVRFSQVAKSFGDLEVLRGIDLEVARGERITIIGPSGSGKSTILRLLMTLEKPTSGEILVEGEPLWSDRFAGESRRAEQARLRRVRGKIGMVFQHFELFPHLTVRENAGTADDVFDPNTGTWTTPTSSGRSGPCIEPRRPASDEPPMTAGRTVWCGRPGAGRRAGEGTRRNCEDSGRGLY